MLFIRKSIFNQIMKSNNNDDFESLKAEVLAILKKKASKEKEEVKKAIIEDEKKYQSIQKSENGEWVIKGGYPVGTIREWKGQKYIKIAPNKWRPKYDSESKGAKNALTRLIKQVENCKDVDSLMKIVMENKQRFTDANGNHLPIVDKLRAVADKKNDSLSSGKDNNVATKKENSVDSINPFDMKKMSTVITVSNAISEYKNQKKILNWDLNKMKKKIEKEYDFSDTSEETKKQFLTPKFEKLENQYKAAKDNIEYIRQELIRFSERDGVNNIISKMKTAGIYDEVMEDAAEKKKDPKTTEKKEEDDDRKAIRKKLKKMNQEWETVIPEMKKMIKKYGVVEIPLQHILYEKHRDFYEKVMNIFNRNAHYFNDYTGNLAVQMAQEKATKKKEELKESEAEKHANRSEGMKGNQNAKKNGTKEDDKTIKGSKATKTLTDIQKKYSSSKSVEGWEDTINVNGEEISGKWKVVEADAPTASHDENTFEPVEALTKNGSTINDRDYSKDKDAQESVIKMGNEFDSRGLNMGSPVVVTTDGVVVSGNNRTMSSKLAAKNGTDSKYIEALKKKSRMAGIDAKQLDGFKNPRLVFEIEHKGDYTTEEYAKFNKDGKKTKNTTEKAVEIAKTVKPEAVSNLAETLSDYDTMGDMYNDKKGALEFANRLVQNGIIQKNELSQYYTEQGGFSEAGKEFVETVLTGSVLNEANLRAISGDGGKSIRRKLVRAILPLIDNKGMGKEYSFNKELNEAVRIATIVSKDHEHYPSIETYLKQDDMFQAKPDEITQKFAEMVHDNGEKQFAAKMKELNGGLRPNANGEFDMFLGRCETRNEVLDRLLAIKKSVEAAISSLFKQLI